MTCTAFWMKAGLESQNTTNGEAGQDATFASSKGKQSGLDLESATPSSTSKRRLTKNSTRLQVSASPGIKGEP
jgi:hypothetical protein